MFNAHDECLTNTMDPSLNKFTPLMPNMETWIMKYLKSQFDIKEYPYNLMDS